MKSSDSKSPFRPFEELQALLEARSVQLKKNDEVWLSEPVEPETDPEADRQLFEAAMADVERIPRNICGAEHLQNSNAAVSDQTDESETLVQLEELIKTGRGFVVADTSEYVEGTGYNVNREVTKRLHNGEFSIQGHIDLHGLTVKSARTAFEDFLKESTASGRRMVLIIHGRGLSSPPILKTKVIQWLSAGRWRKWVMAFASARMCDGGAGATYVLLRNRPATRRLKRGKSRKSKKLLDKNQIHH